MTISEFEPLLRGTANERERSLLRSAKDDASRSGAREQMLASLGVPAAAPCERWLDRLARSSGASHVHGVALLLLVGAVVGGAFLAFSERGSSTAALPAGAATLAAPATDLLERDDETAKAPVVTLDSLPNAPALDAPPRRAAPAGAGASAPSDALDREIARVEAARAALASSETARTLRLLDSYDRDFPRGAFSVEVSVLRIEALARAGRVDEARRLGSRFLAEHHEGAFARRVTATLAKSPAGGD
ncbi:MAG: hypothetical protein KF782_00375 [Labilithrix sp.]|nr:hypothetical protein [Labilithrix sp.]